MPASAPLRSVEPAPQRDGQAAELERLRAQLRDARREVERAQQHTKALRGQLSECMDLLVAGVDEHRNCTPSRRLLTYHKFMHKHGHTEQAEKIVNRITRSFGRDIGRMNRLAWNLMTEKEMVGQFDELALSLAERMEKSGRLNHQHIDTIALAKFLNGKVDDAIKMQKKAIARGGNSHDYRRRLRTYEAALAMSERSVKPNAALAAAAVSEDDEDDE